MSKSKNIKTEYETNDGDTPCVEIIHDGDMRQVLDELDRMSEAELKDMMEKAMSVLLDMGFE